MVLVRERERERDVHKKDKRVNNICTIELLMLKVHMVVGLKKGKCSTLFWFSRNYLKM